jgi:hypothetical protein
MCTEFHHFSFHGLDPMACSDSELTSGTLDPFRHFGRTPWTRKWPTIEKLEYISIPGAGFESTIQCLSRLRPYVP